MTPVYKLSASSIKGRTNYGSMLAGNSAFTTNSFESIATASISGSSGEITFSNIPSGFQHLQIRSRARTSYDDTFNSILMVKMQFNSNTTSGDYYWHWLSAERDSGGTQSRGSNNSGIYGNVNAVPGAYASQNGSGISNVFAISVLDILDYKNTNKFKTTRLITGDSHNRVGNQFCGMWSGLWRNTSAITSIRLFVDAGNFMTNSSFALYGIKG